MQQLLDLVRQAHDSGDYQPLVDLIPYARVLGEDGAPDQHIFLLPGQANDVTFEQAQKWAAKQGGELPTRREQSLLFANLKEEFEERYYWSGEKHASHSDYACVQGFGGGDQRYRYVDGTGRARAVRRLVVEE